MSRTVYSIVAVSAQQGFYYADFHIRRQVSKKNQSKPTKHSYLFVEEKPGYWTSRIRIRLAVSVLKKEG